MATRRDVPINGEVYKVLVETVHPCGSFGDLRACTAVHEHCFARRIGGVRFVPGEAPKDRTELGELAEAMTWKSALAAVPADGEKTVVYCPHGLPQAADMAQILAAHLAELKTADPGVIFGPDINCNEQVMDRLAHFHGQADHVSGLLEERGGLSIDRQGYTASGMEAALLAAAKRLGWNLRAMRATIQGFGAVGAHVAHKLKPHGVAIRAISNFHGALVATTDEGLDVEHLFERWQTEGDGAFQRYASAAPRGSRYADRDAIFKEPSEIFVPAARTDILAMPNEIPEYPGAMDVIRFAEASGARIILEGANHPLTAASEKFLETRGVFILPDYLVNCGGLIGCWADWVYREELEGPEGAAWHDKLNVTAPSYVSEIVSRNIPRVLDLTGGRPDGIREATRGLAKERRDELAARYRSYATLDIGGRGFARACMDELLG